MKTLQTRVLVVALVVLALCVLAWPTYAQRRQFAPGAPQAMMTSGAHYSVVETQAHNLLVTDNAANKLYFYTIDKDKPIGSPLKLRASLDLTKVGEPEITITAVGVEK
jgi:hypothetical protein